MIENSGEFVFFIVFVFNSQNAYVEYKEIQAAQGVKIAAKELEKAIAGEVMVFRNGTDNALKFQVARIRSFFFFSYCMHNRTVAYTLVHMHIIICYYHTMCILLALPVCVRCMLHRQTLHYTVAIFHKAWHKSNFLHQN